MELLVEQENAVARELLAQLYFTFPLSVGGPSAGSKPVLYGGSSGTNAMSRVVQRALKKLMDDSAWNGAYLTLRSISVAHPIIVLRHLNTLAALVEGRVQPSQVLPYLPRLYH